MEYELENPSDPYTFLAEDFETAALTVFSISTLYGAKPKSGNEEESVPVFILGGSKEWYQDTFGRTPDEGLKEKKETVSKALKSMMYGHFRDRKRYEAALSAITEPEKKEEFIEIWQNDCSSLNNIGGYAHKLAKALEGAEVK